MIPRFYLDKAVDGLGKLRIIKGCFEHKYLRITKPYRDPRVLPTKNRMKLED